MKFTGRAVRYLTRKKSKTAILFLVLLMAETMILCTVTILRAAGETKSTLQEKTKTKIIAEIVQESKPITQEEIDAITRIDGLVSINRTAKTKAYPVDFAVKTDSEDHSEDNRSVQLSSYDDLEADGPFADGRLKLTEGVYPSKPGELLVNLLLAEENQWHPGSQLSLKNAEGKEIKALITGIYVSGLEREQSEKTLAVYRIENTIYGTPELILPLQSQSGYESISVYLKDPATLEAKAQELVKILGEKVSLMKSNQLFQKMEQPLEQVVRTVRLILALSIGTAAVVITLLLGMWMRARKKEMAVYLSLGETKGYLFLQIILESLLVFLAATIPAVGTGGALALLLKNKIFSGELLSQEAIKIGLNLVDIGWLLTAGAAILTLAVGISLVPILTANPKDTLSEMEE